MKRESNSRLDVAKVMEDFQKSEDSSSHRYGTFKIDKPFEEALDTVLRARPKPATPKFKPHTTAKGRTQNGRRTNQAASRNSFRGRCKGPPILE